MANTTTTFGCSHSTCPSRAARRCHGRPGAGRAREHVIAEADVDRHIRALNSMFRSLLPVAGAALAAHVVRAGHGRRANHQARYADAAEGLKVYYEIFGKGEPIVVMAGGLSDISSMSQTIVPLSRKRQVIGIELEGHGHTALRKTPMSHERNGDDVAAVLKHLKFAISRHRGLLARRRRGDPHGDPASRDGAQPDRHLHRRRARRRWYPEVLKGMARRELRAGRADETVADVPALVRRRWRRTRSNSRCCSTAWAS